MTAALGAWSGNWDCLLCGGVYRMSCVCWEHHIKHHCGGGGGGGGEEGVTMTLEDCI